MSGDAASLDRTIERYESLLDSDPGLWDAAAWTVVRGAADVTTLLDALATEWQVGNSADLAALLDQRDLDIDNASGRDSAWLIDTGSGFALFEPNGAGPACLPGLRKLASLSNVVASMYWNINSVNRLTLGRRGQLSSFEMLADDELPDASAFRPYQAILENDDRPWSTGLAIVEAETGARLDRIVGAAPWPIVKFSPRLKEALPTVEGDDSDEKFFTKLRGAQVELRREITVAALRAALEAAELLDQQVPRDSLRDLADNTTSGELQRAMTVYCSSLSMQVGNGPYDSSNPRWKQYQAALSLWSFVSPPDRIYSEDGWTHVCNALGDSWLSLRRQLDGMFTS